MKPDTASKSTFSENKARRDFNEFLNRTVKSGSIGIEHIRVRSRQPETEVFARKAMAIVDQLAPLTRFKTTTTDVRSSVLTGSIGVGEAAALFMASNVPALARYLGSPADAKNSGSKEVSGSKSDVIDESSHDITDSDLFSLLSAYSGFESSCRMGFAPFVSTGSISVAAGLGHFTGAPDDVMRAADSVYAQSFADVHAISLRAAFDGNSAAKSMLKTVMTTREAGGDFGEFSKAPLSHDTRLSLELLRAQLDENKDFAGMTRSQLWEGSIWAACEGTVAWMQCNGVDYLDACKLSVNLDAVTNVIAGASDANRADHQRHQTVRPAA